MELTVMNVYELCNKYQWFTHGTNTQYERMFDFVRENRITAGNVEKLQKLATMIWICSSEDFTEDSIYNVLYEKALNNLYNSNELADENSNRFRNATFDEFKKLRKGNAVFVKCYDQYVKAIVEDNAFYNADADEPGWEVETTHGFISIDSVYIND